MSTPGDLEQVRSLLVHLCYNNYTNLLNVLVRWTPPTTSLKLGLKFIFTPAMEAVVWEIPAFLSAPRSLSGPTGTPSPTTPARVDQFRANLEQEQEDHTIRRIEFTSLVTLRSDSRVFFCWAQLFALGSTTGDSKGLTRSRNTTCS